VDAFVTLCFGEFDTHRIEALIEPENTASIRLVERLGFTMRDDRRDLLLVTGTYCTVVM
jgi:RimJ/RimL family protein N-acetyltransferase